MAKKPIGSIALTGFEDLFNVGVRDGAERITEIALTELYPPDFHPFNVVNDDDAAIAMVDANLQQREKLLYSEKAWAYRVKLEALDHNGVKGEQHSYEIIKAQTGDSKNQIFRFLRLTELVPDLLDKADNRQIAFNAAVELSYLSRREQAVVVDCMAKYDCKPSLSQAVRLKKLKQSGTLTDEIIDGMLAEDKKPPQGEEHGSARFRRYFPPEYSMKQIETVIIGLLKEWKEKAVAA